MAQKHGHQTPRLNSSERGTWQALVAQLEPNDLVVPGQRVTDRASRLSRRPGPSRCRYGSSRTSTPSPTLEYLESHEHSPRRTCSRVQRRRRGVAGHGWRWGDHLHHRAQRRRTARRV
ncbi:hypothetical protein CIW52_04225 [Mycolicibacterium sp. P9-64]|nr:hypothetical protein CIW52_04225 [Mycolicibacterium sp. P9-64]